MATLTQLIQIRLNQWSAKQDKSHKQAFFVGGQQLHGGSAWSSRKKFYPWPVLFKTGGLRASTGYKLGKLQVTFTSTSKYAVYHQFGTSKLPQRKIIDVTNQDVDDLVGRIKALNGVRVTGI